MTLQDEPVKPLGILKNEEDGPNGRRHKLNKKVLAEWKSQRNKVVKQNNQILDKEKRRLIREDPRFPDYAPQQSRSNFSDWCDHMNITFEENVFA